MRDSNADIYSLGNQNSTIISRGLSSAQNERRGLAKLF